MAKSQSSDRAARSARPSFSLRLQPYKGALLAEVVHYLNSLERSDAQRQVENVLVMALLAQARLYDETRSDEERRRCCIEACDALDKHASMLRQLVGVAMPMPVPSMVQPYQMGMTAQQEVAMSDKGRLEDDQDDEMADDDSDERRSPPKARIESQASATDVNSLFGD